MTIPVILIILLFLFGWLENRIHKETMNELIKSDLKDEKIN